MYNEKKVLAVLWFRWLSKLIDCLYVFPAFPGVPNGLLRQPEPSRVVRELGRRRLPTTAAAAAGSGIGAILLFTQLSLQHSLWWQCEYESGIMLIVSVLTLYTLIYLLLSNRLGERILPSMQLHSKVCTCNNVTFSDWKCPPSRSLAQVHREAESQLKARRPSGSLGRLQAAVPYLSGWWGDADTPAGNKINVLHLQQGQLKLCACETP